MWVHHDVPDTSAKIPIILQYVCADYSSSYITMQNRNVWDSFGVSPSALTSALRRPK